MHGEHGHDTFDLNITDLSKIEGHAGLDIQVKNGKVEMVKLRICENKRFFTKAVVGKPCANVHQIVSRICGTCSIAHLTCCIEAVENALEVKPSKQTLDIRNLTMYGLNIRDHGLHLYLFCLPDILGKDSVLEFADSGKEHELLHKAFDVKKVGNKLSTAMSGAVVHSPFPVVGGYSVLPKQDALKPLISDLKGIRDSAIEFVDIFFNAHFEFETETSFISLMNENYNYLDGDICSTGGYCIPQYAFHQYLEREVIPYSQALGFSFEGKPYMVGALARMNLNGTHLNRRTRKDLNQAISVFPSYNIFHNNLAQAIEVVHCIDNAIDLLETLEVKPENVPVLAPKPVDMKGVGVVEAPRGTLYYNLRIDKEAKVKAANLVIPTAQNQIKMEKDIGELVQHLLDEDVTDKEKIKFEIEKLIRAYDPCMSCATHFLKINWLR